MSQVVEREDPRHVGIAPQELHPVLADLHPVGGKDILRDVLFEHDPLVRSLDDADRARAVSPEVAVAELATVPVVPLQMNSVRLDSDM